MQEAPLICEVCHQSILPQYYFCPNCGTKLNSAPLAVTATAQTGLYLWSAVLPMILFIGITKWKGVKYLKSKDQKTKTIGAVACAILLLSTIFTIWYAYAWTQNLIQSTVESINTDFGL
jgi:hypothetical protein